MFTPFGQMLTKTLTLMAPSVYGNYVLCRARHLPLFSHTSPTKLEVHTVSEKNIVPSLIQHPGRSDIKQWALGPLRGLHPPFQKFSPTRCCSQHARKLCKESQHTFNRKCNIYRRSPELYIPMDPPLFSPQHKTFLLKKICRSVV